MGNRAKTARVSFRLSREELDALVDDLAVSGQGLSEYLRETLRWWRNRRTEIIPANVVMRVSPDVEGKPQMKPAVQLRCATCGQVVPLTQDTPDSALVELGRPSRFAGVLGRLWKAWGRGGLVRPPSSGR